MIRTKHVSSVENTGGEASSQTRVLLVHGNRRYAGLINDRLSEDRELEASVEHVEGLQDALEAVAEPDYHVILLAIGRQVSRGFRALSALHSRAPSVPIVVLTDGEDLELGINAISLGAQDYLLKGEVTSEALGRAIRYAIERQRSHHSLPRLASSADESWLDGHNDIERRQLRHLTPSGRDNLIFGGIYRAEKVLGLGGMGIVYFGVDTMLDREVAIKVLYTEASGENLDEIRFNREAKTLASLEHPGVVPVYAFGKEGDYNYFVMKYIRGTSLESMLLNNAARLGELLPDLKQVFKSLDYLHARGVIHRDLKPSNIIFTASERAMLVDFGVAKEVGRSRITNTSVLIGTPTYMPPEQAIAPHSVGPASDQYSLGVVLYEILTGRTPFMARSPVAVLFRLVNEEPATIRSINPNVSGALEAVVMKALSKKPDERFSSCLELYQAMVDAFRTSPNQKVERWNEKSPKDSDHRLKLRTEDREDKLEAPSQRPSESSLGEVSCPELGLNPENYASDQWFEDIISSSHLPDAAPRLRWFGSVLSNSNASLWNELCGVVESRLGETETSEKLVETARILAFDDDIEGRESFRELLIESLHPILTKSADVQSVVLFEAFAWLSTPVELSLWQDLIADPEPQRRILGLWALPFAHQALHHGEWLRASFKVVQMLFWAANDPDAQVAVTALRSLARIGIPEVVMPLIECYRSTDSTPIRFDAVEALLELATLDTSAIDRCRKVLVTEREELAADETELALKFDTLLERLRPPRSSEIPVI